MNELKDNIRLTQGERVGGGEGEVLLWPTVRFNSLFFELRLLILGVIVVCPEYKCLLNYISLALKNGAYSGF